MERIYYSYYGNGCSEGHPVIARQFFSIPVMFLKIMKVSIIGATGLLGKALIREWTGDELVGLSSKDVDIRDEKQVHEVVQEIRPDWIVLAAAYTDVDGCESHQDLAFAVNRDGAINVAKAAKSANAKMLFISSDYVFDGRKTHPYETTD